MDLMVNQDSPSQVKADKIKELLSLQGVEKLEGVRPEVAHLFSLMMNLVLLMSSRS